MTREDVEKLQDGLIAEAKRMCEAGGMDTIQIIGTFIDGDQQTWSLYAGHGNFAARVGSAREFVLRDEERTRMNIRKEGDE